MGKWVRTYEEWVEPATWGVMTILCPSSRSLLRVETPPWSESSLSNGSAQGQSTSEMFGFCAAQAFFWCVRKACCTFPENIGRKSCRKGSGGGGRPAVPFQKTSVANPAVCPLLIEDTKLSLSTTPPLATLTRNPPGGIAAKTCHAMMDSGHEESEKVCELQRKQGAWIHGARRNQKNKSV